MKTKPCSKCKRDCLVSSFAPDTRNKSGLKSHCRECVAEAAHKRYWENPEFHRERTRNFIEKKREIYNENRRNNRQKTYITESARRYGVDRSVIEKLIQITNCEICGISVSLKSENTHHKPNIDHCHKTNKVRGLLCGYCNNLIGRAKDDVEILKAAITYLERGYE